ncbi:MAG: leucine--tRNA ligase [bacterium]
MKYNHKKIENEIQRFWKDNKTFECNLDKDKEKYYILDMFPYPSGEGLHVGHAKGYSASDAIAHYMRLKGYNVLHPMGWDAFGLPAENYAIKVKKNPQEVVKTNIKNFKEQLKSLGYSYDWSREIDTTDPQYYKWTQWIFLKLFEKGLAYQDDIEINFCPSCKTGLANEEVQSGECVRCHTRAERKKLKQWVLKITEYADRLLDDIDELDWPEAIKEMQRNWIGRSEGSNIRFDVIASAMPAGRQEAKQSCEGIAASPDCHQPPRNDNAGSIEVYTTRADTLFGCTYVVLAPEHKLVKSLQDKISNYSEVEEYIEKIKNKSDLERAELEKEKTGVKLEGVMAINPINGNEIKIWIADYVLESYGTGAVMAVPAHDDRDYKFAKKYNIEIIEVIQSAKIKDQNNNLKLKDPEEAFIDYGVLINSEEFDGLTSEDAKKKITEKLIDNGHGKFAINYKLRDWVFSRQRYWGEPIPIVHCEKCGVVPLDEKDLPLELPEIESYEPTGDGESPLAKIDSWVNTKCPNCSGPAKRETDTMPNWAGSSWYYLRFTDPKNNNELISENADKYFLPVDFYIGGAEHAVLHLLYARFWHKFLFDIKAVKSVEPFKKLRNVGLILGPDNQKMSKSKGNVVNPDGLVDEYGADALRMYELFIGPFDQSATWNTKGIKGTRKFLEKIYSNFKPQKSNSSADLQGLTNNITEKIEKNLFNTGVSDLMKFSNDNDISKLGKSQWNEFLTLLTPFAPHMSESLFLQLNEKSIFHSSWPEVRVVSKIPIYSVQINGKFRALLNFEGEEENIVGEAKKLDNIKKHLVGRTIKKTIFVKGKIVNFVV